MDMGEQPEGGMMPSPANGTGRSPKNRVRAGGSFRIDRNFTSLGVGRVQLSSGTADPARFKYLNGLLTTLAERRAFDVLSALKAGELTLLELERADARGRAHWALADKRAAHAEAVAAARPTPVSPEDRPLWSTLLGDVVPRLKKAGPQTKRRYITSLNALRARDVAHLGDDATVRDLLRVDWDALYASWDRSAADWNHMRRALSAALTGLYGYSHAEHRRAVLAGIPLAGEIDRVPDITPELFWRIVGAMPEHARVCVIVLVVTGMRVQEYMRTTRAHLLPNRMQLMVPGTKTRASQAPIAADARYWPYIEAGVPSPLRYTWLYIYWTRACVTVGAATRNANPRRPGKTTYVGPRLHDLRHCLGQAGISSRSSMRQRALGRPSMSTDSASTRRLQCSAARRP